MSGGLPTLYTPASPSYWASSAGPLGGEPSLPLRDAIRALTQAHDVLSREHWSSVVIIDVMHSVSPFTTMRHEGSWKAIGYSRSKAGLC